MRGVFLVLSLLVPGSSAAGTVAATHFLSRGPGAAAAALGSSVVSVVQDPTAMYWNPAGLARAGGAVSGEHLFLIEGARYNFLGMTLPSRWGTFGLGAIQLHSGVVTARSAIDDPGFSISSSQTDYILGYARPLGSYWSFGLGANLLSFDIAGFSDRGFGVDFGAQGRYPARRLLKDRNALFSFGGVVKGLVEPRLKLRVDDETLPREFRGGAALEIDAFRRASLHRGTIERDRLRLAAAFKKTADVPRFDISIGLDYVYRDILVFRVGFDGTFAAGFGFRTGDGRFVVDYALENRLLAKNHRFTLTYRWAQPGRGTRVRKSVETVGDFQLIRDRAKGHSDRLMAAARNAIAKKDYRQGRDKARLAALLFPNDAERRRFADEVQDIYLRYRRKRVSESLREAISAESSAAVAAAAAVGLSENLSPVPPVGEALAKLEPGFSTAAVVSIHADIYARVRQDVLRLTAEARLGEALGVAGNLAALEGCAELGALELLKWVEAEARKLRRSAGKAISGREQDPQEAFAVAYALRRAFPAEPAYAATVDKLRKRLAATLNLSPRRRLHVEKLYYLAALHVRDNDATAAVGLIRKILRLSPVDQRTLSLKDHLIREGQLRERLVPSPKEK